MPDKDEYSEIFGFILGGKLNSRPDTSLATTRKLVDELDDMLCPNLATFLNGEVFNSSKFTLNSNQELKVNHRQSIQTAKSVVHRADDYPFGTLDSWLCKPYRTGRTADTVDSGTMAESVLTP